MKRKQPETFTVTVSAAERNTILAALRSVQWSDLNGSNHTAASIDRLRERIIMTFPNPSDGRRDLSHRQF